ncbi:CDP-diacylglycerol--serine O-phosphatidyltransferase [Fulvivirga sp. RKSG066]|uniref:CDP-diacylglycerol--serine O-phosphatidyltransferase n=1 Tax=Fulvivirga aurantia TaxID=2529383 RepID=UPI0012BB90EF|nr:CDP-diacylglycerol--serine O-phosphatidyltransferase [Fulvivirga aurantia]MTI19622.1 CDP-diacylglycerol--serine O-phosphatidyltransferase [Fulvivirga aurantia]
MIKKHIPNFITSCNLASGCIAITFVFKGELQIAVYLMWLSMVFDFFDGMAARLLKVSSPIGKELDSLADVVSFGVLPATIIYKLIESGEPLAFVAFLVAVFSALRLAKFNTDENQETDFIGLPTPANALFLSSLVFFKGNSDFSSFINDPVLIAITVIFSLLLVAPIRLFSLKLKNFSWSDNKIVIIFLILSAGLIVTLGIIGLPFVILLYIALSLVKNAFKL